MRKGATTALRNHLTISRLYSSFQHQLKALPAVPSIRERFENVDINEFRQRAFIPETPILITRRHNDSPSNPVPAAVKWFSFASIESPDGSGSYQALIPSHHYLAPFGATILPYELIVDRTQKILTKPPWKAGGGIKEIQTALANIVESSPGEKFYRFNAPLSLFLLACREHPSPLQHLYIAQAQVGDLPKQLQDDLPTPRLVKEAGKGDVYDSNLWMGIPPTYTPLHKDPNPNLFVQLASSKRVRLFKPNIGAEIFRDVQHRIGRSSSSSFRGEEMMEGPERDALENAVWGHSASQEGFEATVTPGDALFIPKGWWHSIKSVGREITASVNWWFR
jgi:hypothetical protein